MIGSTHVAGSALMAKCTAPFESRLLGKWVEIPAIVQARRVLTAETLGLLTQWDRDRGCGERHALTLKTGLKRRSFLTGRQYSAGAAEMERLMSMFASCSFVLMKPSFLMRYCSPA